MSPFAGGSCWLPLTDKAGRGYKARWRTAESHRARIFDEFEWTRPRLHLELPHSYRNCLSTPDHDHHPSQPSHVYRQQIPAESQERGGESQRACSPRSTDADPDRPFQIVGCPFRYRSVSF